MPVSASTLMPRGRYRAPAPVAVASPAVLLLDVRHGARVAVFATRAAGVLAEIAATYHGQRGLRAIGQRRGGSQLDRGTKQVLVLAMVGGMFAAVVIAFGFGLARGSRVGGDSSRELWAVA
jgi:succinate dehydrogenase hydrophobic anchor subunit